MGFRSLKENDLFLITDEQGEISNPSAGEGLFFQDTRFLKQFELKINEKIPVFLAEIKDEEYSASYIYTNPHVENAESVVLWRESIEVIRKRFIYDHVMYETVQATNFHSQTNKFSLEFTFNVDFDDMFEVRGYQREQSKEKEILFSELDDGLSIQYMGSDKISRETRILWNQNAAKVSRQENEIAFTYELEPGGQATIDFVITPVIENYSPNIYIHGKAMKLLQQSYEDWHSYTTSVQSDWQFFNDIYQRSKNDLRMLISNLGDGPFPVAGLPWFAVPFGRDSIITSLQLLSFNPNIAKGTLKIMARYQGKKVDPWRDEEPGKIMHELRNGELANTNQIPFTPYYGTIDATPLFLVLLVEYVNWTGDTGLLKEFIPVVKSALQWIDEYGDIDEDSFVEYTRKSPMGIDNQGWKDSGNSIVHKHGEFAKAPIALVEVQGYVYHAKSKLSQLFTFLGQKENRSDYIELGTSLAQQSETLKMSFEQKFWMEEEQFYALALDGQKNQVQTITSNPGHLLMSKIMDKKKAKAVAERLLREDLFSGYGIRTMSTNETAYNPMSYHNGSVWPHDNSLCILGMSHWGLHETARMAIQGLLTAAESFDDYRLPELFCGYGSERKQPIPYPVACSPQAWAAGTMPLISQVLLGLQVDAILQKIELRPFLLPQMNFLHARNMKIGQGILHIDLVRQENKVQVDVVLNTSGYEIVILEQVLI